MMIETLKPFTVFVIVMIEMLIVCYATTSTELVEETGCFESEFKLTCNHIDSTIGILEASFKPNCENSNGKSNKLCLLLTQHYEEGQNSIMKVIAQSLGNRLKHDEEQAARNFLEALRHAREKEQDREEKEARTSEYRTEINSTDIYDMAASTINETEALIADFASSDKRTLRENLEKLTSFYLTRLIEDNDYYSLEESDEDNEINRNRRDLRQYVTRKFNRRKKLNPGSCTDMSRRIGTLDQFEILKSLKNFSNTELNIRKSLNYRCSGKNHCSFIFATDHPYATFWEKGTVNIKYICMDAFRVNKYCGELLHIGNEVWDDSEKHHEEGESDEVDGFPKAEARRHNDQSLHQFTNVKILKPEADLTTKNKTDYQRAPKNNSELKILKILDHPKPQREPSAKPPNKFSQDFRIMKVLPNEVPAVPNLDNVKKEEYIFNKNEKNDEKLITSNEANIETNEIDSIVPTDGIELPASTSIEDSNNESKGEIVSSVDDDTTPDDNEIDQFKSPKMSPTLPSTSSTSDDVEMIIIERKDLEKTVLNGYTTEKIEKYDIDDVTVFAANGSSAEKENLNLSNGGQLFGSPLDIYHREDDEMKTTSYYDDYSAETIKPARPTEYSYRQKSLPSSTLLHGFISNPGYPSFYVGKTNECKWKLKINEAQTIALTILDLHLRIDIAENCKDSLEIVDPESRKSLYRGCAELSRPVQIKSMSNTVEIILKTKSLTMYPKRGFLIHYKAVGCVLPVLQSRLELDYQSEDIAKFVCNPNHVFPDSSSPERVLQCINDSWNDTLVNCVELAAINGSGPVHLWYNARLRKENTMSSADNESFDDVLLPLMIVAGLFIMNAIVFIFIVRYRRRQRNESLDRELADL